MVKRHAKRLVSTVEPALRICDKTFRPVDSFWFFFLSLKPRKCTSFGVIFWTWTSIKIFSLLDRLYSHKEIMISLVQRRRSEDNFHFPICNARQPYSSCGRHHHNAPTPTIWAFLLRHQHDKTICQNHNHKSLEQKYLILWSLREHHDAQFFNATTTGMHHYHDEKIYQWISTY